MGRPKKYNVDEIVLKMEEYINNTDDPQLSEFCLPMDIPCRDTIHELSKTNTSLSDMVKRLTHKQEVFLTRCGNGTLHASMAIFRLKQNQHGYRDKNETEITGKDGGAVEINVNIVDE